MLSRAFMEPWRTPNSRLKKAPKMFSVKPFKQENSGHDSFTVYCECSFPGYSLYCFQNFSFT